MRLDRLNSMEQYVIRKGTSSLEELALSFGVSINTVRRDLNEILARGQIKKVYGGVAVSQDVKAIVPTNERSANNAQAKRAIGRAAASFIKDNMTVFIDSGSTTVCVLPNITGRKNVTVVTQSLDVMYEAAKNPELQVIALGGQYSHRTSSYVGISTLESLSRLSLDMVLIAATGVSLERGLTNTTYLEAEIKRSVVGRAKRTVLMADSSKFDRDALISFCPFESISAIVTDKTPPPRYMAQIERLGIECVVAEDVKEE